jgi:hypothetical protein
VTDFQLQNGWHLVNARFHYTVLGTPATRGHQTLTLAAIWKAPLVELMK